MDSYTNCYEDQVFTLDPCLTCVLYRREIHAVSIHDTPRITVPAMHLLDRLGSEMRKRVNLLPIEDTSEIGSLWCTLVGCMHHVHADMNRRRSATLSARWPRFESSATSVNPSRLFVWLKK